ncbi:hypothetical protein LSAT2_000058 [Lamellibrachia satsuma]|nr:hypothetical protein LSAT2_000058 [Lamellibrachia satsuma]
MQFGDDGVSGAAIGAGVGAGILFVLALVLCCCVCAHHCIEQREQRVSNAKLTKWRQRSKMKVHTALSSRASICSTISEEEANYDLVTVRKRESDMYSTSGSSWSSSSESGSSYTDSSETTDHRRMVRRKRTEVDETTDYDTMHSQESGSSWSSVSSSAYVRQHGRRQREQRSLSAVTSWTDTTSEQSESPPRMRRRHTSGVTSVTTTQEEITETHRRQLSLTSADSVSTAAKGGGPSFVVDNSRHITIVHAAGPKELPPRNRGEMVESRGTRHEMKQIVVSGADKMESRETRQELKQILASGGEKMEPRGTRQEMKQTVVSDETTEDGDIEAVWRHSKAAARIKKKERYKKTPRDKKAAKLSRPHKHAKKAKTQGYWQTRSGNLRRSVSDVSEMMRDKWSQDRRCSSVSASQGRAIAISLQLKQLREQLADIKQIKKRKRRRDHAKLTRHVQHDTAHNDQVQHVEGAQHTKHAHISHAHNAHARKAHTRKAYAKYAQRVHSAHAENDQSPENDQIQQVHQIKSAKHDRHTKNIQFTQHEDDAHARHTIAQHPEVHGCQQFECS